MAKDVVSYKDSDGNSWEANVGEGSGCFTLPGEGSVLYSIRSLINFIKRSVASVQVIGADSTIEDGGEVGFDDAVALTGDLKLRVQASAQETQKIGKDGKPLKKAKAKATQKIGKDGKPLKKAKAKSAKKKVKSQTAVCKENEGESPLVANCMTLKHILSQKHNQGGLTKKMVNKQTGLSSSQIGRVLSKYSDYFRKERKGNETFYFLA